MNLKRLLLPLDGSDLAEVAIVPAVYLAKAFGASITLLHVVESSPPQHIHGRSIHITNEKMATEYLQKVATDWLPIEIPVDIHVHSAAVRNVATSIVQHIQECHSDAVIMCAHGKGNPRQWWAGNNGQQIFAQGETPIFFFPSAYQVSSTKFSIQTILLPLDGMPEHERSIAWAESLAEHCHANIKSTTVIPTPETLSGAEAATRTMLPGSTAAFLEISAHSARTYLEFQAEQMRTRGAVVENIVLRGDPAEQLIRLGQNQMSGIMVLGSHANAGNAAFWNRSVAAHILQRISIPVLLVPVKQNHSD
jgi:nucleotide-binding universal stress UspA family protein